MGFVPANPRRVFYPFNLFFYKHRYVAKEEEQADRLPLPMCPSWLLLADPRGLSEEDAKKLHLAEGTSLFSLSRHSRRLITEPRWPVTWVTGH